MRRMTALAAAVAAVGLGVSVATGAIASPIHQSASLTKVAKKFAKKYARQYARKFAKPGPAGPAGSPGIAHLAEVESQEVHLAPGQSTVDAVGVGGFRANCAPNSYVVGTGFNGTVGHTSYVKSYHFFVGGYMYNDSSIPIDVSIQAICASGPGLTSKIQVHGASAGSGAFVADARKAQEIRAATH